MNEPFDATGALVASLIDAMPEPVLVVERFGAASRRQCAGARAVSAFAPERAAGFEPARGRSA